MSNRQFFFGVFSASILGALIALGSFKLFGTEENVQREMEPVSNVRLASFLADTSFTVPDGLNFVYAAEQATPGVVHIKSTIGVSQEPYVYRNPIEEYFRDFFGHTPSPRYRRSPRSASGSGVIISADGYIATNNHVVDNAENIVVKLYDNREYVAKLIGTDPTTDIALIKIEADNLPYIKYGNSDEIRVGEWVLAVGNPFDLTSTVTAGIVSAKSRNINILNQQGRGMQIEAFIQTDAAVNPGNSGGALVNLKGELVGINTAIATPTGAYAGYSFAVPVSLVKKVVNDLKDYGVVQRALLGVSIRDIDANLAEEKGFKALKGVYINGVGENSAAQEAGIKSGDVIVKVDGIGINTVAQLQEQIGRSRPGDKVDITYMRGGKEKTVKVTLKNSVGTTSVMKKDEAIEVDGATFVNLSKEELAKLGVEGGVKIEGIVSDKWRKAGLKEGFVITSIHKKSIESVSDFVEATQNLSGRILIEGVYPDGRQAYGVVEF